jgi:nitrite reductase (NADH) small subunit
MSQVMEQAVQGKSVEVEVCGFDELPIGIGRTIEVAGKEIAIFRTRSGTVHAIENRCPHKGGPLADGMIAGNCIVCPFHAFKYNLTTGACDQKAAPGVGTYGVRVEEGRVWVSVT